MSVYVCFDGSGQLDVRSFVPAIETHKKRRRGAGTQTAASRGRRACPERRPRASPSRSGLRGMRFVTSRPLRVLFLATHTNGANRRRRGSRRQSLATAGNLGASMLLVSREEDSHVHVHVHSQLTNEKKMMPLTERNCAAWWSSVAHSPRDQGTADLGHRPERLQVVVRRDPEHGEAVQAQRDAQVVRDRDVGVAGIARQRPVAVRSGRLEDDRDQSQERFQLDVFCCGSGPRCQLLLLRRRFALQRTEDAPFQAEERVRIARVHRREEQVDRERMRHWVAAVQRDDERPFAAAVARSERVNLGTLVRRSGPLTGTRRGAQRSSCCAGWSACIQVAARPSRD